MNLMISILVKHLEHKSVSKQPEVQLSIVEVIASLAEQSRAQASAATIGAISDLVRHMKKTLQVAVGSRELELVKWNDKLRKAVDDCIVQLSKKVLSSQTKTFLWHSTFFSLLYSLQFYQKLLSVVCIIIIMVNFKLSLSPL
jgi:hypothetical protein